MGNNIKFFNICLLIFRYDFNNLSEQYQMRKQLFLWDKNRCSKNSYVNLRYQNFRYNADICAHFYAVHSRAICMGDHRAVSALHRRIANHRVFTAQCRMSTRIHACTKATAVNERRYQGNRF